MCRGDRCDDVHGWVARSRGYTASQLALRWALEQGVAILSDHEDAHYE